MSNSKYPFGMSQSETFAAYAEYQEGRESALSYEAWLRKTRLLEAACKRTTALVNVRQLSEELGV